MLVTLPVDRTKILSNSGPLDAAREGAREEESEESDGERLEGVRCSFRGELWYELWEGGKEKRREGRKGTHFERAVVNTLEQEVGPVVPQMSYSTSCVCKS